MQTPVLIPLPRATSDTTLAEVITALLPATSSLFSPILPLIISTAESTQAVRKIHHHFGLTQDALEKLHAKYLIQKRELTFVRYYDTKDYRLLQRNWWLMEVDVSPNATSWVLKQCDKVDKGGFVAYEQYGEDSVRKKLRSVGLGRKQSLDDFLGPPIASFLNTRYTFLEGNISLYVDVAAFGNDFYLLGTLDISSDTTTTDLPDLSSVPIFQPVRSKVVEFLWCRKPELYRILEKSDFVPSVSFFSAEGLNHFQSHPIPVSLRFLAEEKRREQLISRAEPDESDRAWMAHCKLSELVAEQKEPEIPSDAKHKDKGKDKEPDNLTAKLYD
jgi:hypothetical protein